MSKTNTKLQRAIASRAKNYADEPRKMGIEIEFAGLSADEILEQMQSTIGGSIEWLSPFEIELDHPDLGVFKLELDSSQIKELGIESSIEGNPKDAEPSLQKAYIEIISKLSENLVPWEIVTPPLKLKDIEKLFPLVDKLREAGALGTKSAVRYAFGVHLNPEPDSLDTQDLLQYMRSFFCLYEWILKVGAIDIARRITPYINHFKKDYVLKIIDPDYTPTQTEFIEDYIEANPTRNRSVDMLPMFAHLDEPLLKKYIDDDRVKARPTFHYRLPNCEIDNPEWSLHRPLEIWFMVEELANDAELLSSICEEYQRVLESILPSTGAAWVKRLNELVELPSVEDLSSSGAKI